MEHNGIVKVFKSLEDSGLKGFLEASGSVYEEVVLEFFANAKVLAGIIVSLVGEFASVLTMEHNGIVKVFKSLEDSGLKGFLEASGSVYEEVVLEFFANAKVLAGIIVSLVGARNIAITKDMFIEVFVVPFDGLTSFLTIPKETVIEMRQQFSGSNEPYKAPNKKNEMKIEFRLLHDIVAKALCAKAVLLNMVKTPKRQSQGFAIQVSALLRHLVKENLGESVKMHPQKVLTTKQNEDTASNAEGGESQGFQPIKKVKPVNRKKKSTEAAEPRQKNHKVSTQIVEARSQVAPPNFDSERSSKTDSCPLVACRHKRKQRSTGDGGNSKYDSIPTIPVEGEGTCAGESLDTGSEEHERANRDQDAQMSNVSQFENQGFEIQLDSMNQMIRNQIVFRMNKNALVQIASTQKPTTLRGPLYHTLVPGDRIAPRDNGKKIMEVAARLYPVAEHCQKTGSQQLDQPKNETTSMISHEHPVQENEPPAQKYGHQAVENEHQAHNEQAVNLPGSDRSLQKHSADIVLSEDNPETVIASEKNNCDHQGPVPSNFQLVVPTPTDPSTLQFMDTTTQTLITLSTRVSSLDLTCAC
ncbi:hypothetical protein F511_16120 [Dorcoceras hygrometricum]|uniref:Uncharacterized protein n=1 Tax=Dorcoceras hygrometricum TaxID=472368 RepID=A0A2Z7CUQ1_9LAMI|nr:hypothetical protein F511_16120 [Dorcoceras hygrometricum]